MPDASERPRADDVAKSLAGSGLAREASPSR